MEWAIFYDRSGLGHLPRFISTDAFSDKLWRKLYIEKKSSCSFHLNAHAREFYAEDQKVKLPCTT